MAARQRVRGSSGVGERGTMGDFPFMPSILATNEKLPS